MFVGKNGWNLQYLKVLINMCVCIGCVHTFVSLLRFHLNLMQPDDWHLSILSRSIFVINSTLGILKMELGWFLLWVWIFLKPSPTYCNRLWVCSLLLGIWLIFVYESSCDYSAIMLCKPPAVIISCILYWIYSALNQILFSCYGVIWQKTNDCQNKFVSIAFYL